MFSFIIKHLSSTFITCTNNSYSILADAFECVVLKGLYVFLQDQSIPIIDLEGIEDTEDVIVAQNIPLGSKPAASLVFPDDSPEHADPMEPRIVIIVNKRKRDQQE